MARKVWLEVALNGSWTRRIQPRIPITADEIVAEGVACVRAGAAIVHAHTLDAGSGRQNADPDNCAAFMRGIREQVDAIVYPTAIEVPMSDDDTSRYATSVELARRGLLEWGVLDPGSTNFGIRHAASAAELRGSVYANSVSAMVAGIELAAKHRFHPAYACYEPGFVRGGAALHRAWPSAPQPVYRLMFSDHFTFSFPPERWALEAYVRLLELESPGAPWMIAGLAVDVLPLIPAAVELGGHVRVGLEDAPFGCARSNSELVMEAVLAIQKAGGEPATASEVRAAIGSSRAPRLSKKDTMSASRIHLTLPR